jgi:hypothetical protein
MIELNNTIFIAIGVRQGDAFFNPESFWKELAADIGRLENRVEDLHCANRKTGVKSCRVLN